MRICDKKIVNVVHERQKLIEYWQIRLLQYKIPSHLVSSVLSRTYGNFPSPQERNFNLQGVKL